MTEAQEKILKSVKKALDKLESENMAIDMVGGSLVIVDTSIRDRELIYNMNDADPDDWILASIQNYGF